MGTLDSLPLSTQSTDVPFWGCEGSLKGTGGWRILGAGFGAQGA